MHGGQFVDDVRYRYGDLGTWAPGQSVMADNAAQELAVGIQHPHADIAGIDEFQASPAYQFGDCLEFAFLHGREAREFLQQSDSRR